MKKSKEENNNNSIDLINKLKNNMNKTNNQPTRYNSAYKKRPFSTFKTKIRNFDRQSNMTKTHFYMPKLGRLYLASKCDNLRQNRKSFLWGRNKQSSFDNNKYFAKEELVEKVVKLQRALNKLNDKNTEQKIKLYKQKKELKKQNQMLNEVNKKYYFEQFFKNFDWDNDPEKQMNYDSYDYGLGYMLKDKKTKTSKSFNKNKSTEEIKNIPNVKNPYFQMHDNLDNISYSGLRELYRKMVMQNDRKDKEITILKEQLKHNKISYEALLSNMKIQYKQLLSDNEKKKEEIAELKKNSKCTKFNEIMEEKEIYEKVMLNMKMKFNKAMEAEENYKISLQKIKLLMDEIDSKEIKIGYMENKLKLNAKNSETNIEYLKNELNKKSKRLKKLENEFKKLNIKMNLSMGDFQIPSSKNKDKKIIVFKTQNNNFMIIPKSKNSEKIEEKENDSNKYNDFLGDKIMDKNNNFYQNMNFSIKAKENNNNELNKNDIENDLNNIESLKIINKKDEISKDNQSRDNNEQNKENNEKINVKTEYLNENENLFSELLLIYIELIKRKMNPISFINEIFSKLNNESSTIDNKKIFFDYLIQYFNISDDTGKKVIENLSNNEFKENKSLEEIKNNQIEKINEFSNKEKNENEEEFLKKFGEIDENNFNKIIEKYDNIQSGLVYYNQMISIIKELNMEEYTSKILLLTKDIDVFNLFNYQNLLNIITEKNKNENNEKKESQIINENNEEKKEEKKEEEREEKKEVKEENENEKEIIIIEENSDKEISNKKKYDEEIKINNEDKNKELNEEKNNELKEDKNNKLNINKNNKSNEQNEESEEKYDDFNQEDLSENVLKNLSHFIVIEGSTPKLYINFLKEEFNSINVINPEKLFKFLEEKKIQINDLEKEEIINKYGIENNEINTVQYIDFDKFTEKLFELIKNDDITSNGEDFMKNIKSMEIDGID